MDKMYCLLIGQCDGLSLLHCLIHLGEIILYGNRDSASQIVDGSYGPHIHRCVSVYLLAAKEV